MCPAERRILEEPRYVLAHIPPHKGFQISTVLRALALLHKITSFHFRLNIKSTLQSTPLICSQVYKKNLQLYFSLYIHIYIYIYVCVCVCVCVCLGTRGEWRRLHNEELYNLYRSPNMVRIIKSRRLRWAGHVARMEEGRSGFKILTGKPTGKRPLGRPGVDGRTILE